MDETFVYVIATVRDGLAGSPCKVGTSANVEGRLKDLQTACPFDLLIVRKFKLLTRSMAEDVERCFHDTQSEKRLRGEWFDMAPKQVETILNLQISWMLDFFTDLNSEEKKAALTFIGADHGVA